MSVISYESILVSVEDDIGHIRLNRPAKLNAFSRQLVDEVIQALAQMRDDDNVRVVILSGEGRAFSAGYDLAETDEDESSHSVMEWRYLLRDLSEPYAKAIWEFRKPIIAATQGYCLAGACEIAMLCDMTIASDDCQFGEPEIRLGGAAPTLIMPWLVPMKIAKELLYTGKLISAQRAYEIGMVNEVVPREDLDKRARYHARMIAKVAPLGVELTKDALNRTYEIMGLVGALAYNNNVAAMLSGSETEEFRTFEQIRMDQGLRAALAWRDQQFREVEDGG